MNAIPLQTVRPFVSRNISLETHEEEYDLRSDEGLMELLEAEVSGEPRRLETARMQPP